MIRSVACGISGGVDSAVAAALLKSKGFDVVGVFMENWDAHDDDSLCKAKEEDLNDAMKACHHLKIPFSRVSFVKDYWNDVFTTLLTDYEAGLTPNPDVLCNRYLKFGSFFNYARNTLKVDAIATGHYARTSFGAYLQHWQPGKRVKLKRALDLVKDQTLFLSSVCQEPLQKTMFPLGDLYKSQVRRMASQFGMHFISEKKDSTGICFIGKREFPDFISRYLTDKSGPFIDIDTGKVIGEHKGVHRWTIGQRCRLGGSPEAYYVAERDPKTQIIYAAQGHNHPSLFSNIFWIEPPHWIDQTPPEISSSLPFTCMFKFQHKEWTIPAQLLVKSPPAGLDNPLLTPPPPPMDNKTWLAIPTRAITPGQQGVFYKGDECLGSAKILKTNALHQYHHDNHSVSAEDNINNTSLTSPDHIKIRNKSLL